MVIEEAMIMDVVGTIILQIRATHHTIESGTTLRQNEKKQRFSE
jgi:hypothetical protein